MRLEGKTAIVTGAANGIGKAICLAMAREGARIGVTDVDGDTAQKVADEINNNGGQAQAFQCNVANASEISSTVRQVLDVFGSIDILVNNAGINILSRVVELRIEDWDTIMAINLRGAFLCAQAVLPHMMIQHSGKIINISSDSGRKGWATASAYCASKFGLIGFTEALSAEVAEAYHINVNAICPSGVNTELARRIVAESGNEIDWQTAIQPDDVANLAVFLASEEARMIHGASLDIFGYHSHR